ncbi:MAG: hypothetical protein L0Y39_10210 [Methylococcaceae bacterium]|nr:hypothetical protein [Methylococcaceae bacterium]MCI0666447.1 hypothetical protein [Methylococcaceae bacterium]
MNSIDVDDGPKVIKKYETSKDPGTGAVQYQQLGLPPEWTPPDNPTTEDISRWNEKLLTNGFEGATLTADCRLVVLAALPELKQDANRGRKVLKGAKAGHAAVHGTEKQKRAWREEYRRLLDELRSENPGARRHKIYELAEAVSEIRFGKRCSYKIFDRLEKKARLNPKQSIIRSWDSPGTVRNVSCQNLPRH